MNGFFKVLCKSGILIIFLIYPSSIFAQSGMNKISVSPLQLFVNNRLNIEYERGFNEGKLGIAFYLGKTGSAKRLIHDQYSDLSEQSFSMKFYAKNFEKCTFWYGGTMSVSSGNIINTNGTEKAENIAALGVLATGGYQIIYKSFYTNFYLGGGYAVTNNLFGSAHYFGEISKPTDFLLIYGLKMGITF